MKKPTRLLAIVIFAVGIGIAVFLGKSSLSYLIWMASDLAWLALALLLFNGFGRSGPAPSGGGLPGGTDRSPSANPDRSGELVGAR